MIIRAIKLRVVTERGDFGFSFQFSRNLTIVRAGNSSGKSTLFNSVLYALGMEELIGGKGEKTLPYAVKDYFEYDGARINVAASEVFIEIENSKGNVVTLRRAIHDSVRDSKLVEVFSIPYLTNGGELGAATPTYLHDAGGAKKQEGFHRFLETFLELHLPQVPTTSGGEAKLYLQTVFAALAVEQKRGWTDYVANVPFYGIRDARTRVVEFLLGLSVFETNSKRNRLNSESVEIDTQWRQAHDELRRETASKGVATEGVPNQPTALFEPSQVVLKRHTGPTSVLLDEYIAQLRIEYSSLRTRSEKFDKALGIDALKEINAATEQLQELSVVHERTTSMLGMNRSSLREYETLLAETQEDLERNKTAAKLRDLGASHGVEIATGHCPTCHQHVEDTLLSESVTGPQMDLATNIGYLESQSRMLQRQVVGLREAILESEARRTDLSSRLAAKHDFVNSMRGDISSGATESKAMVRRQVQIEVEVEGLQALPGLVSKILGRLRALAVRLAENQAARKLLPKSAYTQDDLDRISMFQKQFRANAGSFGYESAPISEVEISLDALVPCLAQLELRAIRTDIKSDSSASDFVRLIWSYLLALQQTSSVPSLPGNHPGILLLDEPGQHSMAVDSQHALLQQLASQTSLQSIVAASFDEAEAVFIEATQGVKFQLIQWNGKLLRPLT
jgi:hypothetical protein